MEKREPALERTTEPKEHYAYLINILLEAHSAGDLPEVEGIIVEPDYGYIANIRYKTGEHRIVYGHDPGLNHGSSEELVKDKGYTKFILRQHGINCPRGDEFLLPWWADTLRSSDRQKYNDFIQDTSQAQGYIDQEMTYPVYVKPSRGSQGVGVTKVHTPDELAETLESFDEERVKVALVEEGLQMPDYRLLVFDGELVNAYERQPLSITGDGLHTIEELVNTRHTQLLEQGRDIHMERQRPLIEKRLGRYGLQLCDIAALDQRIQLLDISNLSAGGTPKDIMDTIHPRWAELAREISSIFNLRVCGVDLACKDISISDSDYSVIEVNATPGAKQFMATGEGEQDRLKRLFIRFFEQPQ